MNRTLILTSAAFLGAAALTTAALSTTRVTLTDAPGLASFELDAPHHGTKEINGIVWYPSLSDGHDEIFGENGVFYGVEASQDATLTEGTYPLIMLSHGMGGHYRSMAWLGSALAEQGAIVVAVNHPNSSWGDFDIAAGMNHWTRAQDISVALDWILSDPRFEGHIDESRVMAAGFSYGGWTALSLGGLLGNQQGYADHCAQYGAASSHCNDIVAAQIQLGDASPALWNASYADPRITDVVAVDPGLVWGLSESDTTALIDDVRLIAFGEGEDRLLATDFDQSGFAAMLPDAQINRFAPASHFMFLPLCKPDAPAILASENDDPVCTDPVGSNRAQLHDDIIDLIATDLGL